MGSKAFQTRCVSFAAAGRKRIASARRTRAIATWYMPLAIYELDLNRRHQEVWKVILARDVERAVELSVENYNLIGRFIEGQMASKSSGEKAKRRGPYGPKERKNAEADVKSTTLE